MGASAALHLAEAGAGLVVLLEREPALGTQTTRAGAGFVGYWAGELEAELARYGIEFYERLQDESGKDLGVRHVGLLFPALSQAGRRDAPPGGGARARIRRGAVRRGRRGLPARPAAGARADLRRAVSARWPAGPDPARDRGPRAALGRPPASRFVSASRRPAVAAAAAASSAWRRAPARSRPTRSSTPPVPAPGRSARKTGSMSPPCRCSSRAC